MSDLYEIIKVPDAVLKQEAQPVVRVDDDLRRQMDKMLATMYAAPGIGLAANQVNLLNRVLVMDVAPDSWHYTGEKDGVLQLRSGYKTGAAEDAGDNEDESKRHPLLMANPEVIWQSEQKSVFEEGCLSIPLQYGEVERPAKVRVKYLDYDGKEQEMEAEGLLSHCVQHEIDHLNGVLFIDYLSKLKRDMMVRRVQKLLKSQQAM